MFYHEHKGKAHKVMLKTLLPILLRPNWDRSGFKPSLLVCLTEEIEMDGCSFFCESCNDIVEEENVYSRCYHCNDRIPLNEAVSPSKSLGIYCKEHAKEYFEDEKPVPILEFLASKAKKPTLRRTTARRE